MKPQPTDDTAMELSAPIIGISRHRLMIDGPGVSTLVAFKGCPLKCHYCLNPHSIDSSQAFNTLTPRELYDITRVDEIYFLASGGGVTFGGGEPCLRADFIDRFRHICGPGWHIALETSLNVPADQVEKLIPVVDEWIIDIKTMNPDTYLEYTGRDNRMVIDNLNLLASRGLTDRCVIRLPLIPAYNDFDENDADRNRSRTLLTEAGFTNFDPFTYIVRNPSSR